VNTIQLNPHNWYNPYGAQGWSAEMLAKAKVMVIGAGAIGNEVLKNLALLGLGHIWVVDYDTIEYSNLSRSILFREEDCKEERYKAEVIAERLEAIHPGIKVYPVVGDLRQDVGLGLIREMDVVIGCLDNLLARRELSRRCSKAGKP
jgi:adenylyltransferase/sulfurtransferase